MSAVMPASVDGAREFLANELRTAMTHVGVTADQGSVGYLADLVVTYMKSDSFFARTPEGKLANNVLAELYFDSIQGTGEKRAHSLRRLGDICLLVTGVFPDSLRRKLVDLDYYFDMGGSAYAQLSSHHVHDFGRALFAELSMKFIPFSNVLGEITEKSGLQNDTDLLRLYERWMSTGNDRLKKLLSRHGILTPVAVDVKIKH